MGLGAFPGDDPLSLSFLGMHGTVYANYAVDNCDLLLALGVRFDDRVTGKVSEFAARSTIVHIDVDPSEINKIKKVQLPICSDVKYALAELNKIVQPPADLGEWHRKIETWKQEDPLDYDRDFDGILPQHALDLTVAVDQGPRHDHLPRAWASTRCGRRSTYKFRRPRRWLSSLGLGTMGFGLPAAMGAKAAHPEALVIDVDGDGSLLMNIQEMATCYHGEAAGQGALAEQHAPGHGRAMGGPFPRLEPRPHLSRADRSSRGVWVWATASRPRSVIPTSSTIAKGFQWGARHVRKKEELRDALLEMIDSPGPVSLGRAGALPRARAADDPVGDDGEGFD